MKFVRCVHGMGRAALGARAIRLYDPDIHIIEVGEPMESVVKKPLERGLSVEDTAKHTPMREEFVRQHVRP